MVRSESAVSPERKNRTTRQMTLAERPHPQTAASGDTAGPSGAVAGCRVGAQKNMIAVVKLEGKWKVFLGCFAHQTKVFQTCVAAHENQEAETL
jgi:hypothetical protein